MRHAPASFVVLASLALWPGCSGEAPPSQPGTISQALPEGVAARIGDEVIPIELVARVSAAQGIAPPVARDRLVETALFAAHARDGLAGTGVVSSVERASLSRALLERLAREARARGEPTDDELESIVQSRWTELDRPPAARTSHAVVLVADPSERARARRIAERIAREVRGVKDAGEFRRRAEGVPRDGAQVRVEQLPAVTADGRVLPEKGQTQIGPPPRFDPKFSAAANAISEQGEQSGIVESSHGLHIILLEERLPEKRLAPERRRELLRDEVFAARARALEAALFERLGRSAHVEIDRAAEALTSQLRVRP